MKEFKKMIIIHFLALFFIGIPASASAQLTSPNCEELRRWSEAVNAPRAGDSRPPNPLGGGGYVMFSPALFAPSTRALFGKPILDWTEREIRATFLDQNNIFNQCGSELHWIHMKIKGQMQALINYSERRNAARRVVSESLDRLEEARPSINLLRLYEALSRLPSDVEAFQTRLDVARDARRSGLQGADRSAPKVADVSAYRDAGESLKHWRDEQEKTAGRRLYVSLSALALPDFAEFFGDIKSRLQEVRQGVRVVFEHDLRQIERSFPGYQAFERKVKDFEAEIAPWMDELNREKARASITNSHEAIGAGIGEWLVQQIDAVSPDINGWRTLEGLEEQIKTRYSVPIGKVRLENLLAKVGSQKVGMRAAMRNDLLAKIEVAPPTLEGVQILDRVEGDSRGQLRAVLAEDGRREVDAAIMKKRAQIAVVSKGIFDEFNSKYEVEIWPDKTLLHSNPFMFEGRVVGLAVSFQLMLSRESAVFDTGRERPLLVSAMPRDWGVGPDSPLMLAVLVTGNETLDFTGLSGLITSADYVGARVCRERSCAEAFRWAETADTFSISQEVTIENEAGVTEPVADEGLQQAKQDLVASIDPDQREGEPSDGVQSFPIELKAIVLRGDLTVRGMRAFGLLRRSEEALVVSLRSRGVDLLGASYDDLKKWLSSGIAEGIPLSPQEKNGLEGLLSQMESLKAAVATSG